ncbi:MAG: M20/M25/M40 family metallo-hydrolase [Chitinispirillaceae bacterium]|nr:M20/M25/M40 family metallo-hydrolase [Chitinispirillaceae bacterium]
MDRNIATVIELMKIPGKSGEETQINNYVVERLMDMGVSKDAMYHDEANKHSEIGGELGNLIVRFPGRQGEPVRMLSTHLDTVPGALGSLPALKGDKVLNTAPGKAMGADARAGVAILLAAAQALMDKKGDHPPCVLTFFVQEEIGLVGSKNLDVRLLGNPKPAMCFNFDGGVAEEVANAVVGTERIHIELKGVAAHTAHAEQGISCAVIFADAVASLQNEGWIGVIEKDEWASSNIGIVRGGTGSNVTMSELYALGECRSFDLALREQILSAWRKAFTDAVDRANKAAAKRGVKKRATVSFKQGPEYKPYRLSEDAPAVLAAVRAIGKVGRKPELFDHRGGQDTCNIVEKGIPAVGMGMGDFQAHSVDEWLDVPHFLDACRIAVELALGTEASA